jgi:deoxyribodipyrimidine photolyase-related protein
VAAALAGGLGRGALLFGALPAAAAGGSMSALRVVLGDQLSPDLSALRGAGPGDVILMMEVAQETGYVPHHPQKVVLVLAAMRHFAQALRAAGLRVDYVKLDDPDNTGTFSGELLRAVRRHPVRRVVVTEPGEWRVRQMLGEWPARTGLPLELRPDERYFATPERFAQWARGRRSLRMEFFYRELRRQTGLLMNGNAPAGGRWNFDAENRRPVPRDWTPPARLRFEPDAVTRDVIDLLRPRLASHFGDLEPFGWAVTRAGALQALEHFIDHALPQFGATQDAMTASSPFLHHSLLAPYLNLGLLHPREVCARAEAAWRDGRAPLNAVEGFIRQILGWREFIRGIYWLKMPGYAHANELAAERPLPALYWGAPTPMRCLSEVVAQTRREAYSHHIQRLMVTGNFALLAGINPAEVAAWYLAVYADAFDWVQLPNTLGMALYADGGLLASKPYAASGAYIRRMSDFCRGCRFDPAQKTGPRACPFTTLYWDFLIRHESRLRNNPRMALPYRNLDRWSAAERAALQAQAQLTLAALEPPAPGPKA